MYGFLELLLVEEQGSRLGSHRGNGQQFSILLSFLLDGEKGDAARHVYSLRTRHHAFFVVFVLSAGPAAEQCWYVALKVLDSHSHA